MTRKTPREQLIVQWLHARYDLKPATAPTIETWLDSFLSNPHNI